MKHGLIFVTLGAVGSFVGSEMPSKRQFGHIDGIAVGRTFVNRVELAAAGVHRPRQAGICGTGREGAESIVLSGGYEDDQDLGAQIIYTGHGGRDPNRRRQIGDQSLDDTGNAALVTSELLGKPVRVVRGAVPDSPHAPKSGYRYDGLFLVMEHWSRVRPDGFKVIRFRLEAWDPQSGLSVAVRNANGDDDTPVERRASVVERLLRNILLAQELKHLHGHRCQFCGERIEVDGGYYAEGAHIRPLGTPHNGPDAMENMLCLCPNDHTRFDKGGVVVGADHVIVNRLTGADLGELRIVRHHSVSNEHLAYHRQLWQPRSA